MKRILVISILILAIPIIVSETFAQPVQGKKFELIVLHLPVIGRGSMFKAEVMTLPIISKALESTIDDIWML